MLRDYGIGSEPNVRFRGTFDVLYRSMSFFMDPLDSGRDRCSNSMPGSV